MSDELYRERAQLVAALSKVFPASVDRDPAEPEWFVVFIDLPTGQVSWHIAPADLPLFDHLPRYTGRVWDGHTTPEKYERLNALVYPPLYVLKEDGGIYPLDYSEAQHDDPDTSFDFSK